MNTKFTKTIMATGIAAAALVASCGLGGSAFAEEVPNNAPKPAPVTTPTVKPEDDIYGSGSEWDQLQNTENDYENYYDQMYNTHTKYGNGDKPLPKFDPHMFDEDHDPNGNDTKPEIPDEHKDPQTPPAPKPDEHKQNPAPQPQTPDVSSILGGLSEGDVETNFGKMNPTIGNEQEKPDEHKQTPDVVPTPQPKVDTTKEDAEFKVAQDLANQKAQNALLLKQIAEGSVKALQAKVNKATGAEKVKLQEQLENAQKIATAFSELNDKATSMVKAYTQAATIRGDVKALEGQVATAQAKFDALAKEQTGPSGSEAYNKAAEELGKLQKQLKSKKNLLEAANKGVTKAEETLVKQETKVQEVQNPKKEEPQAPKFNVHDALAHVDSDKVADYKLKPADVSELVGTTKKHTPTISEILSTVDGDKVADYKLTPADVSELVDDKKQTPSDTKFDIEKALAQIDGEKAAEYKLTPVDVSEFFGTKGKTPTPDVPPEVTPDHTPTISEILATVDGDKVAEYKMHPADVSEFFMNQDWSNTFAQGKTPAQTKTAGEATKADKKDKAGTLPKTGVGVMLVTCMGMITAGVGSLLRRKK